MAFNIKYINKSIGLYVLILLTIPTIVTSNIDCGNKPFHCVNSTHFMICVDLGGGVSRTIDNHVFECPSPTVCQPSNSFECEFPEATTLPSRVSDVTNELQVNKNTTLWSENTVATSNVTNTSQVTQPEAILTIHVTSTATTNAYTINDQNITDNASDHTDGLLINVTPGYIDVKTDVSNNDIIRNVTTAFDSATLPVDSMSPSTNMSTDESTTTYAIYITSKDIVNETASTNNILGIENVTETTERINSSTDQGQSSTFLILNETNSLSTDIESSTTSGYDSNASTIDIPPKDNTNKSVVSGDALEITNKTENVFPTESFVTASSEGILTTLVLNEGTAITISTDISAIDNQSEYKSSVTPITNNITETNATTDGLISKDGITDEVETTNNLPIDSVTLNNVNVSKVETNPITEATTISTDQGLSFDYQFENNTNKNDTSNNIGNNKTLSIVNEQPKDNINKSVVSDSAIENKNKSENLFPPQPEVALPNIPLTLPSVVLSSESTITTDVITESTAVTISTNENSASTGYSQSQGESSATVITNNISEYYSTTETSTSTSRIGATGAIEMATTPFITDIKNDVTAIVEPINLPIDSVTSTTDNVNTDVITKVTDDATVLTDESIVSTIDHLFEVTTSKYDMSNNVINNKTVSMIDEQPKHHENKSEVTNNAIEIENRTENIPFNDTEGVLSKISVTFPSATLSSNGTVITLATTEATEITTSVDKSSDSASYNQSENKSSATDIINNISEYYSTTETSTSTSRIGATGAIEMATTTLITDIKNDVTAIVAPTNLPIDSVTSTNANLNTDVITKVTDDATVLMDKSIGSTIDHLFEVTTSKYDMSNNVINNKTVSMIDEQPKHNANKSEVTNNAIEIENRTENIPFTDPEGVISNISVSFPSVTSSSEGTIITLATTEATEITTSVDKSSASATYNQSENKSSATEIINNISEYYSTTETSTSTSRNGATGAIEMATTPLITDIKNDVTAIVEPINLPIDSVTSTNANLNTDVITKVTDDATVLMDKSIGSTIDHLFEVTTSKYDMSNNVINNKTVSMIDEQPKHNANKSEVTNNAIEIENRTENIPFTDPEGVISNISVSFPSVTSSSEGTIITLATTEATEITTSVDKSSASATYNQSENKSSATEIINNISEYYSTTETSTSTSRIGATGAIEMATTPLITDIKNDVTAIVEPINLPIDSVTSTNANLNTDVITKVTNDATVLTDKSIGSTIDHLFEVTTSKYDMSNNVINNKTVSMIDEQPKHNANKSEVTNNAIEIGNRTENIPFTDPEGVISNISVSFPSVTSSSEGTIITLATTEATEITTSVDKSSASATYNQSENKSSATDIINISEYYSTTETLTSTSRIGATGAIEMATTPLITDIKNDVTAIVEPINLPIDSVTSTNANLNTDVITKVTDDATVLTDKSIGSTIDHLFEVTTNKYDMSNNAINNKTVSMIDEQLKHNENKSEMTNNAIETENRTESIPFTDTEGVLSNISVTFPSVTLSSEGTIITLATTEAIDITNAAEKSSGSTIYNQNENKSSITAINNNFSEHFSVTEAFILTSKTADTSANETTIGPTIPDKKNDVTDIVEPITLPIDSVTSNNVNENKDKINQFDVGKTVSTDQSVRSTTDYLFEVTTNKYDMSNNKTMYTIEEQLKDYVNKSDVSNNTTETGNRTENGLIIESNAASSIISISLPSIEASGDATASTAVITEDTTITISIDVNLPTATDKQPEENTSVTDIFNNKFLTNFTTENITATSQSATSGQIETIAFSITATTQNESATITLPTVTSISVTETTAVSTDKDIRSTIDSQFQVSTNKYDTSKVNNNKTVSTIDENLNDTVNESNVSHNSAIETKNRTEKLLPPGSNVALPIITVTVPSVRISSESIAPTDVITEGIATIYTNNNSVSTMGKQPEIEISATTIINNTSETNSTTDSIILTTKTNEYKKTTASIIAPTKNVTPVVEPIGLPTDLVSSLNSKQDVISQFTESTTFSRDQSLSSTLDYEISSLPTSKFTDNKTTKKIIDETHFAEKVNSITEENSPTHTNKEIITPKTNANTQSSIKNIHEKGSSVNNGFTNVMREGTRDVINDFNKNNNVIRTTLTPMSSNTNSYKDSNTISTIHNLPSQLSTSHVIETDYSVRNSTNAVGQVSDNNPLINTVFNNNNTNIQPITTSVSNETNWNSNLNLSNSTKPLSKEQNSNLKRQQLSHDNRNSNDTKSEFKFSCNHHRRGKYADQDNCRKFYICVGRPTPIVGECPANTVFSEHTKQCTKNLSHCVRGNQFHCETSGRFSDLTQQSVYYICVKNKLGSYVRFKFQCQKGYSLNKETVRCIESESERSTSNDNDSENERKRNRYDYKNEQRRQRKNEERDSEEERSESKEFECEEEGKFAHPDNCRQYYKCSKNRRSQYRRRIKSCDSDELFDESKKKCVDAESYECQSK